MNIQQQEHDAFTYATDTDWDNADALQRSHENTGDAWVLTDRDVWHANPFYTGPEVPHPEDDEGCEEYYIVGNAMVALYEDHLQARQAAAWNVGLGMVDAYFDHVGWPSTDCPF